MGYPTKSLRNCWLLAVLLSLSLVLAAPAPSQALKLGELLDKINNSLDVVNKGLNEKPYPEIKAAAAKSGSFWDKIFGGLENSWEKSAGESTHAALMKKPGPYKDAKMLERFGRVARKLVPTVERQDLQYRFTILDTDEVNAFAVPGGYVYVTKGLMKQIGSDDELAGVVAHELAHINKKHSLRQAEKAGVMALVIALMGVKDETEKYQKAAAVAAFFASMKFSRDDEYQADRSAVEYTMKAGYRPEGLITFFEKINRDNGLTKVTKYFSTHPPTNDRIKKVKEEIVKRRGPSSNGMTQAPASGNPQPSTSSTPAATTAPVTTSTPSTPAGSNQGDAIPGISDLPSSSVPSSASLQAAYEEYCFKKSQYEYLVSQSAPVEKVMKALKEYQNAKEKYFTLKQAANR
jgi:predicted Zn-dependent protease